MPRRANAGRHSAPGLRRRGPQRKPKRRFILYCEGKNTEPANSQAIQRACSSALISVEPQGGVDVPMTIVKAAVARTESEGSAPSRQSSSLAFVREAGSGVGSVRPR